MRQAFKYFRNVAIARCHKQKAAIEVIDVPYIQLADTLLRTMFLELVVCYFVAWIFARFL